jgi:hypothetical protein
MSRASDIEAEVYEAVRSSGLLADLEDDDDLHEPDEEDEEDDDDEEENDEENEDDYGEVSKVFHPLSGLGGICVGPHCKEKHEPLGDKCCITERCTEKTVLFVLFYRKRIKKNKYNV